MKIASWNIRGENSPFKQQEIRSLVFSNNISLLGLNETRVHQANSSIIANELLRCWKVVFNYISHPNGRIWVLWNPDIIEVEVIYISDQMIHVAVKIIQKQISFFVSFIYGLHTRSEQTNLWQSLLQVSGSAGSIPWIVLGDFNTVRKPEERVGGNLSWSSSYEDFDRCCALSQLEDLRYTGH